jgi:hypothetical protein
MSLTGSSNKDRRREAISRIINAAFAEEGSNNVEYAASNMASAIGYSLDAVKDHKTQQQYLTYVIHYLNSIRKPIFEPGHCEECDDANDIIEVVTKALNHVDVVAAAKGLATILRILIDSTRDSDLAQDIEEEIEEALFPDETEKVNVH